MARVKFEPREAPAAVAHPWRLGGLLGPLLAIIVAMGACGSGSGRGSASGGAGGSSIGAGGTGAGGNANNADGAPEAGGPTGSVHVAWVIESSGGSPTDCVSANTNNIEIAITKPSQVQAFTSFNYCVDMHETFGGIATGDYSIQLSLFSGGNVVATATANATVTAGGVADAGTLILKLAGT
jgi:hypothetical protein